MVTTNTVKSGKKINGFVSEMMATPPKINERSTGISVPYGLQLMMMMMMMMMMFIDRVPLPSNEASTRYCEKVIYNFTIDFSRYLA